MMDYSDPRAITIVCPDMSQNGLGRALVLAEVAQRIAPAKVVGVQRRTAIWPPGRDAQCPLRTFPFPGVHRLRAAAGWLAREVAGSAVVISKPRVTSLELARLAGVDLAGAVLDIDDWELGLMLRGRAATAPPLEPDYKPPAAALVRALDKGINAPVMLTMMERRARRVPTRLVSNEWLQSRFGGQLLPHLRDTSALAPSDELRRRVRTDLALGDRVWTSFVGTARSHKGLTELIEAVARASGSLGLLLCGIDTQDRDGQRARDLALSLLGDQRVRVIPPFPSSELRQVLSAADVATVPSRAGAASVGQIPAKLFDALSMGLPLVATRTGTHAEVVGDAGVLVPPGDVPALAAALAALESDPGKRVALAARARRRATERFDVASGVPILRAALQRAFPGGPP